MATKRTILYFDIDRDARNRYKAVASLKGKTLKQWAVEAMEEKLERDLAGAGKLLDALRLAEALRPRIAAGTKGKMNAARDLRTQREERLKAVGA
jgi:hypothetical protein